MTTITWLHLSDLHFRSGTEFETYNRTIVLESLWADIRRQMNNGLQPDFIVFSGDVAHSGRPDEFDLAVEHFFDPLLKLTGLGKDCLFIVPGNHDISRNGLDELLGEGLLRRLLVKRDAITRFLGPDNNRNHAFNQFSAYGDFINNYFGKQVFSPNNYFYTQVLKIHQQQVAILGLNSAWMCGYHKNTDDQVYDDGYLLIGERQLLEALGQTKDVVLRIAVVHHSPDLLHEIDRHERKKQLAANCDIILHGHWHEPDVILNQSPAGRSLYLPVGSVYASRDFANGYSFGQINLDTRQVKIHLRRYTDQGPTGPAWVKDLASTGDEADGIVVFDLDIPPPKPKPDNSIEGYKVLFAENDPAWQNVIRDTLHSPDYDLHVASSSQEAITQIDESFDLILVNLSLGAEFSYDGELILRHIRKRIKKNIPCIVLTGMGGPMRGLFDRYKVFEVYIKGKGEHKSFNVANFLDLVEMAVKAN